MTILLCFHHVLPHCRVHDELPVELIRDARPQLKRPAAVDRFDSRRLYNGSHAQHQAGRQCLWHCTIFSISAILQPAAEHRTVKEMST